MPSASWVPDPLRREAARRWDAASTGRVTTLVRRGRRRGRPSPVEETVVDELAKAARKGQLSPADRAKLAPLVAAYLHEIAAAATAEGEEHRAVPEDLVEPIAQAFTALYQPVKDPSPEPPAPIVQAIADQYHRLYYHRAPRTWRNTFYRGNRILKLPLDMWVYGEILWDLKPSLVVETGTRYGGSALWFADQLDLIGHGRVVTVDIDDLQGRPEHDRITYLLGSSTDPGIVDRVRELMPDDGGHVLVVLDSDHSRDHVLGELRVLSELVTTGSYVIVEDTDINGHPVLPKFGPGPMEAVDAFLAETDRFEPDESREKYYVTQNPRGYLRRVR
ncbi:MAG: CmcI family methyltransferase [Candidatus Nanopelagicales bacterium]